MVDIRNASSVLDRLLLQAQQAAGRTTRQGASDTPSNTAQNNQTGQDLISLSDNAPRERFPSSFQQNQTQLVSEDTQALSNGFRRLQQFESGEGRSFTRVEEFTTTPDRSRRTVIQQNDSGSTTTLENVLDRQDDGSFRLTQRFTDGTGETSTNIQFNVTPNNADILLGRTPAPQQQNIDPSQLPRGREIDLSA